MKSIDVEIMNASNSNPEEGAERGDPRALLAKLSSQISEFQVSMEPGFIKVETKKEDA